MCGRPLSVLLKDQCVGPHRMKWQVSCFRHLYGHITGQYLKLNPDCFRTQCFHLSLTKFYITHINQNIITNNVWMEKWMYEPKNGPKQVSVTAWYTKCVVIHKWECPNTCRILKNPSSICQNKTHWTRRTPDYQTIPIKT